MKRRTWSIRTRILTLLFAPMIPLLGMWIFSTGETLGPALRLLDAKTNVEMAGQPASEVVRELQAERKLSVLFVSDRRSDGRDLSTQRAKTDEKIAKFRQLSGDQKLIDAANDQTLQHLDLTRRALDGLVGQRASVDRRQLDRGRVMTFYNGVVDRFFGLYGSIAGVDEQTLARQASTVIALTEAREMLNREDAMLGGFVGGGSYTAGDQSTMASLVGVQRYAYQRATRYLHALDQPVYQQFLSSAPFVSLRSMEDRLISAKPGAIPIDPIQWRGDFAQVNQKLLDLEGGAANRTIDETMPTAIAILVRFGVAGGLGLIIIVALIVLATRNARRLIARVYDLRRQALEVAEERLPSVVRRLRDGGEVDVDAETAEMDHGADELGQLGEAFTAVQRTAITSAVQEANLRNGLNQVFLNIARRNQTLLHRQLSLLDAMERRITDPADLEELFRIDHLAARMRRHAEDLVILAGAHPGRGWRNPVPMTDVLRASVSEVEEYTRISLVGATEVSLAGRAVSDVVHLLAELLENATLYSPGDTSVKISGQAVPNGFAVEIEDRGVGMPAEAIEDANDRLRQPPDFDPAHSSRLGHFVVAKLAGRHGILVTLRSSPFGGITAVVLLPAELITKPEDRPAIESSTDQRSGVAVPPSSLAPRRDTAKDMALVSALARVEGEVVTVVTVEPVEPVQPAVRVPAQKQIEAAPALTAEGLPLRQRQANLAPNLREAPPPPATTLAAGGDPSERMRSRLTQMQAGMVRGRRDAEAERASDDTEETA